MNVQKSRGEFIGFLSSAFRMTHKNMNTQEINVKQNKVWYYGTINPKMIQKVARKSGGRVNLERECWRKSVSKLTRSTSSLNIGANSEACLHCFWGNGIGNNAIGACTSPTPGTVPDLCIH